jgi:hypothetical protein
MFAPSPAIADAAGRSGPIPTRGVRGLVSMTVRSAVLTIPAAAVALVFRWAQRGG